MSDGVSSTGLWVDSRTGLVVESEPEEGRLLVSPGGMITPRVQAMMRTMPAPVVEERTVDTDGETTVVEDDDVEDAVAPSDVETATASPVRETASTPRKRASGR